MAANIAGTYSFGLIIIITLLLRLASCQYDVDISRSSNCDLPPAKGPCRGRFNRFFYNATSKACDTFVYGGCQGNANRFRFYRQCEQLCGIDQDLCSLNRDSGSCRARIPSFFYNSTSGRCERFMYGGCDGNTNRFRSLNSCKNRCACKLPPDAGNCKAEIPSFYFDTEVEKCKPFVYGGCGGNHNRFSTAEQCQGTCRRRH